MGSEQVLILGSGMRFGLHFFAVTFCSNTFLFPIRQVNLFGEFCSTRRYVGIRSTSFLVPYNTLLGLAMQVMSCK
jgi:hypothetical protein